MDNVKIHHVLGVSSLMNTLDLEYCYLPLYTPDYQQIELLFSFIKRKLKFELTLHDSIVDSLGMVTQQHGFHIV
eukprot:gene11485-4649_t